MGHLDETTFRDHLGPCPGCGGGKHELRSVIDQAQPVLYADADGAPRWTHDGEKFVDGTYRIACAGCRRVAYTSDDCPRCHAAGALPAALKARPRVAVPKKCPRCDAPELTVFALIPSVTVHTGGPARPKPVTELHDDGHHVVKIECDTCGVIAQAEGCPVCAAPGPLRPRP